MDSRLCTLGLRLIFEIQLNSPERLCCVISHSLCTQWRECVRARSCHSFPETYMKPQLRAKDAIWSWCSCDVLIVHAWCPLLWNETLLIWVGLSYRFNFIPEKIDYFLFFFSVQTFAILNKDALVLWIIFFYSVHF